MNHLNQISKLHNYIPKEPSVDQVIALLKMPLSYHSLVMEITNRCNSRCAICYQSAGSSAKTVRLDLEKAVKAIEESAILECVGNRFHMAGGEAFLFPEDCFRLFRAASENGFLYITTTTNGFWAENIQNARTICKRMRETGVTSIELSWDVWHGEFIPAQAVENCLLACGEYEIPVNLRLLVTKTHNMEESLSRLRDEAVLCAKQITCGPVFATGRAAEVLPKEEFYASRSGLNSNCHALLNLAINTYGEVFPCCAGLDACRSAAFGNICEEPLTEIVERMDRDPVLRQLVFLGPGAFLPMLEKRGIQVRGEFLSICQMCSTIFSNPEYLSAIREDAEERRKRAFQTVFSDLDDRPTDREG